MSTAMKKALAAILKNGKFEGEELTPADQAYLKNWADSYADDPIWDEVVADARKSDRWPHNKIHSTLIRYALQARRVAESVKSGDDPLLREKQKQRDELLSLAKKADDLAHYFKSIEKYSGIANFFQRFLVWPVTTEQEAVPRIESSFLRIRQLQELHEREAKLLRQRAARAPKATTFISKKKVKRYINAFIHSMSESMAELCDKQHRHAVALLASLAHDDYVANEDVRRALDPSTKETRRDRIRAFGPKNP